MRISICSAGVKIYFCWLFIAAAFFARSVYFRTFFARAKTETIYMPLFIHLCAFTEHAYEARTRR